MVENHWEALELAQTKQELLQLLLQEAGVEVTPKLKIPARPEHEPLELSPTQQRLWFFHNLQPEKSIYNVSACVRLLGRLDLALLEQSLTQLIERHHSLRTIFWSFAGQPMQRVQPPFILPLPVEDLQPLHPDEQEQAVTQWLTLEAQQPFDLSAGPLLRARLLRLEAQTHVLLLTLHHIITDGWSMGIFLRELGELYQAAVQGLPNPLPPLACQYPDFVAWQREWLRGPEVAQQLAYWRQQLAGAPTVLHLPTDRPHPLLQTFDGKLVQTYLPAALYQSVQEFSQQSNVTLFMTLLAAFFGLLYRYTGQTDLLVGSPIANRRWVETESLIGFFANTLALRMQLSEQTSFQELLTAVQRMTLEAFDHQDVPFERLVEELQPIRDLSRNPLVQVAFALQNAPIPALDCADLRLEPVIRFDNGTVRFDLEVHCWETATGLRGDWTYNQDLFETSTIERMVGHYEQLLAAVVAEPGRPIASLNYLGAAEQEQLQVGWNQTATAYPKHLSIPACFEQQAATTPEALAVEYGCEQLSYGQLNGRANQLARHLQALGLQSQQLVAVYAEPGLDLVVALLAILKAGGAYLPLDRAYPAERIGTILTDAAPPILLTQSSVQSDLPEFAGQCLCLDQVGDTLAGYSWENLELPIAPQDLAYVIYTSGSTGLPKGVMVPHQAVLRLVLNTNYVHLSREDRIAQVSNLAFDAATFEVWGALLNGGVLVGVERSVLLSAPELVEQLRQRRITTMFLTTALFNRIVGLIPDGFKTLKYLLTGGEACDPQAFRTVLEQGCPQQLLHVYGPTENTTFSTYYRVETVAEGATSIPIGRPIANTQCYVLDPHQQLVPVGVPGELFVGGDGLALGYLNREQLSGEKFVVHPFAAGERLYRTGDLVRLQADGNLEFLGRLDNQVKLRGFRIELGEIERTLEQHPQVETAVVLCPEVGGEKRLVGYLVRPGATEVGAGELREFLKQRLPEYMVPAAFVWLPELPLTPNGKLDLKALLQLETAEVSRGDYVAPGTPLETLLIEVWQQLLPVTQIGIHDNFFDLGGHSLLLLQMQSLLQDQLKHTIAVVDLFRYPTVHLLAQFLMLKETPESSDLAKSQGYAQRQKRALNRYKQMIQHQRDKHE